MPYANHNMLKHGAFALVSWIAKASRVRVKALNLVDALLNLHKVRVCSIPSNSRPIVLGLIPQPIQTVLFTGPPWLIPGGLLPIYDQSLELDFKVVSEQKEDWQDEAIAIA